MSENEPSELAEDRDFISGIYNYCDRWCEKCPFTSRCRVYFTEAADGDLDDPDVHDINNEKFWRRLESIFREAHEKIAVWAEETGVDLESIESQAAIAEHEQREQEADEHQLSDLARQYAATVQEWFEQEFVTEQNVQAEMMVDADGAPEIDVARAAEVLRWYQFFVAAKVIRALMGRTRSDHTLVGTGDDDPFAEAVEEEEEEDDFEVAPDFAQEDGNGSAKIALIAIDRSIAAWCAMEMCLPGKSDSIAPIFAELERLRWLLEVEFPDARGFMRPGFDEADTELVN
ncbi:MAG TPA: hypothetical protein VLQ90_15980 [Pyrinomonadaceae bacterium]|nr:hypothetical protein [Pyrinomonadaceae bacterium]